MSAPVYGHTAQRKLLAEADPTAVLLLGPPGVGKRLVAEEAAEAWGFVPGSSIITITDLRVDTARTLATMSYRPGAAIIDIDKATPQALNVLLKPIEETPDLRWHWVLVASDMPIPTIRSRCMVVRFGHLARTDLAACLSERFGMDRIRAEALTDLYSTVSEALAAEAIIGVKPVVLAAVRGAATGDDELFEQAVSSWTAECSALLGTLCAEQATGQLKMFTPAESAALPPLRRTDWLAVWKSLSTSAARPKVAVRAALTLESVYG